MGWGAVADAHKALQTSQKDRLAQDRISAFLARLGKPERCALATRFAIRSLSGLEEDRSDAFSRTTLTCFRKTLVAGLTAMVDGIAFPNPVLKTLSDANSSIGTPPLAKNAISQSTAAARTCRQTEIAIASCQNGVWEWPQDLAWLFDTTNLRLLPDGHLSPHFISKLGDSKKILSRNVWHKGQLSKDELTRHMIFRDRLSNLGCDFWNKLYIGLWNGTFENWDLALEVAQIPEDSWDRGFDHISQIIAGIEERSRSDRVVENERLHQAVLLLSNPNPSALAATGLAQLIEMATLEYKREVSNALPDEMEPLENLPKVLRHISLILTTRSARDDQEDQLRKALGLMANTLEDLNGRLMHAKEELEACRRDGMGRRLFADAFYEKAGERVAELITSKVLWGGLASGTGFILGGGSIEALTTGLETCFHNIIQSEATSRPSSAIIN